MRKILLSMTLAALLPLNGAEYFFQADNCAPGILALMQQLEKPIEVDAETKVQIFNNDFWRRTHRISRGEKFVTIVCDETGHHKFASRTKIKRNWWFW